MITCWFEWGVSDIDFLWNWEFAARVWRVVYITIMEECVAIYLDAIREGVP